MPWRMLVLCWVPYYKWFSLSVNLRYQNPRASATTVRRLRSLPHCQLQMLHGKLCPTGSEQASHVGIGAPGDAQQLC